RSNGIKLGRGNRKDNKRSADEKRWGGAELETRILRLRKQGPCKDRPMADMNESLKLDPNYAPAYFTRGRLSYIFGNNPAAIEDFTKSIRLDAENGGAYFNRGVAYY